MRANIPDLQEFSKINKGNKLLIIDDDEDILYAMRDFLEMENIYETRISRSIQETKIIIKDFQPDIAFIDIKINSSSGLDLISILKNKIPDIRCIMMTAYRNIEYPIEAIKKGANNYVLKPIIPENIIKLIQDELNQQYYIRISDQQHYNDELTGLPGRNTLSHHLHTTLHSAQRDNKSFGVIFLDLDNFKNVNDSYGHQLGDEYLLHFSRIVKKSLRKEELLCRMGGDEFVIIQKTGSDLSASLALVERIKQLLESEVFNQNAEIDFSFSAGISIFPDNGKDPVSLLKDADLKMYEEKRTKKINGEILKTRFTSGANNEIAD